MDNKFEQIIVIVIEALKKISHVLGGDSNPKLTLIFKLLDVLFPAPLKAAGGSAAAGLLPEEQETLNEALASLEGA